MRAAAVAILIGSLIGQYWATPLAPSGAAIGSVPLLCVVGWLGGMRWLVLMLAWLWSGLSGGHYVAQLLPQDLWSQNIELHGCIVALPHHGALSSTWLIEADNAPWGQAPRVRLRSLEPRPDLHAGDCRRFLVRLKPPHGQINPGQFDRQLWLYRDAVHATGYTRPLSGNALTGQLGFPVGTLLRFREHLSARLHAWPRSPMVAAVLPAIVVGDRHWIDRDGWTVFQATGTSHLMAISGLHVGLLAGAAWWAGHRLGCWLARLGLPVTDWALASLLCFVAAIGYALLAGLSIPTVRAASMAVLVLLFLTGGRRLVALRALALASANQAFWVPATVLAAGFWLSYGAVLALLVIGMRRQSLGPDNTHELSARLGQRVRMGVRTQCLLSLALVLPGALFFGQVASFAPLINLLAIPWFTVFVLPASLAGALLSYIAPWLAQPLLDFASTGLGWLLLFLRYCADVPGAAIAAGPVGALTWALLALAVPMLLAPRPLRQSRAGLLTLLLALLLHPWPRPAQHRLLIFDVGQGTAALVISGAHAVLLDTGPRWPGGDAGAQTVLPVLRYLGVQKLDMIIVSHGDADHVGGLASIMSGLPVTRVLAPAAMSNAVPTGTTCLRGQSWSAGEIQITVDHPRSHRGWSRNDGSCVVTVSIGGQHLWFPGDIEAAAETVMTARAGRLNPALVLVPHHGSATSSTPPFIAAASPRYAVITAGFLNRWGFPDSAVERRWQASGSCVLNTAETGALLFAVDVSGRLELVGSSAASMRRPWVVRAASPDVCNPVNDVSRRL